MNSPLCISEGDLCRSVAAYPPELVQHLYDAQVLTDGVWLESWQGLAVVVFFLHDVII